MWINLINREAKVVFISREVHESEAYVYPLLLLFIIFDTLLRVRALYITTQVQTSLQCFA